MIPSSSKRNINEIINLKKQNQLILNSSNISNKFSDIINKNSFVQYKLKSRNIEYKIYKSSSVDNCESSLNNNKSINLNNYSNFKKLRLNLEIKKVNPLIKNNIQNLRVIKKSISRNFKTKSNYIEENSISKKNKKFNSSFIENESFLRKCLGLNKKELYFRHSQEKNKNIHLINVSNHNLKRNENKMKFYLNKYNRNNSNYFYNFINSKKKFYKYKVCKNLSVKRNNSDIIYNKDYMNETIIENGIDCPEESHFLIVNIIQKTKNKNIEIEKKNINLKKREII